MNTNGWLVSPAFAKWAIGSLLIIGIWVGTIQADIGNKADKIDVATQVATQTEVLKGIAKSLNSINTKLNSFDATQRTLETDVAVLKSDAEKKDE